MMGYGAQSADTISDDIHSQDLLWEDVSNTLRILVASDCHLGYMEKDEIRREDTFKAFDEICSIAEQKKVDFVLLGGNLFHENKPSKSTLVKAIEILRRHCLGDNPVQFQVVRDQTINFANAFGHVNYEDPHFSVGLPVFSIHGNCDGPAGVDNLSAVDILSACNLLNYFGKTDLERSGVGQLTLCPILIRKGSTSIALYGLGNITDERFNTMFQTPHAVEWMRPEAQEGCQISDCFNIFVLHQKRAKENLKNTITEHFLPRFLDFVVWGHEHECLVDPQEVPGMGFHVTQPGSSVATSLIEGDSKPKHVLLLQIKGNQYRPTKIPLTSVRPFEYTEVFLKDESDINANDQNSILEHLDKVVRNLIEKSNQKATVKTANKLPLVRVKVDYSGFMTINPQRFGQKYVGKVANPQDILIFSKASRKAHGEGKIDDSERLRPEELNQQNIEALVAENNLNFKTNKSNSSDDRALDWNSSSSFRNVETNESNSSDDSALDSDSSSLFREMQEETFNKFEFGALASIKQKTKSAFGKDFSKSHAEQKSARPKRHSASQAKSMPPQESVGHFRNFFGEISYIGEGAYGVIFRCQHIIDNHIYAIKKVGYNDAEYEKARNEVMIHARMDHTNVVRYYQSWTEEYFDLDDFKEIDVFDSTNKLTHTLYIQLELCDRSLGDLMEKPQKLVERDKATIYNYVKQIFEGVNHIHSKGIIHADITRSNIFLSKDVLKIGDFGKAMIYEGEPLLVSREDLGFALYQAPETLEEKEILIDPKIDIYSVGVIFYELAYLDVNALERIQILKSIQSGTYPLDEVAGRFLSIDPANRPTAAEAILIFDNLLANGGAEPV